MLEKDNKITPKVLAVCISRNKHTPKKEVVEGNLRVSWGLVGDAHAAPGKRQVSLLAIESIAKMQKLGFKAGIGDFAENITTQGLNLPELPVGQKLMIGKNVILEISQIGKQCPKPCAVYYKIGDCIMPREGIFAEVLQGGKIKKGDEIKLT